VILDGTVVSLGELTHALTKLSRRQRDCLTLKYLVGLTDDELAAVLGVSVGSVQVDAALGLERFHALFGREVRHATA
jgi:DNA-directed RNA polymerase specialized sigma24 family protein